MKNQQKGFINFIIAVIVVSVIVGYVAWDNELIPKNIISRLNKENSVTDLVSNYTSPNVTDSIPQTLVVPPVKVQPDKQSSIKVPIYTDIKNLPKRPLTTSYIFARNGFKSYPIVLKFNGTENFSAFDDNSIITFSWQASWADSCTLTGYTIGITPVDSAGARIENLNAFVGNSGTQRYQVKYGGADYPVEMSVYCTAKNPAKDSGVDIGIAVRPASLPAFSFISPTNGTVLSRGTSKNIYINEPSMTSVRWTPNVTSIRLGLYDASTDTPIESNLVTPVSFQQGRGNYVAFDYRRVKDGNYYIKVNQINYSPVSIKSSVFKITTNAPETSDINKKILSMLGSILGSYSSDYSAMCDVIPDITGDGGKQTVQSLRSQLPNSNFQCQNGSNSFAISLKLENDQRYTNTTWCVDSSGYFAAGTIDKSRGMCTQ